MFHSFRSLVISGCALFVLGSSLILASPVSAQDEKASAQDQDLATEPSPQYPINVAIEGETQYVVDLDLPGVWQIQDGKRSLYVRGSNLLRKPLNRVRCVAIHPEGGLLLGDSATREVYHVAAAGAEPKPLCNSRIGIAMAIEVSPDGKTIYVGDAEKRSVLRLPIEGGDPELVVRVNARGLDFDSDGNLWAVTPDDAAIHRIDVDAKTHDAVITGRPYQYPNGLVWQKDRGFVTDGYGKAVWTFTADGKTEKWHEGEPLVGPVGLAINEESLFVADPKQRQLYQFSLDDKSVQERL